MDKRLRLLKHKEKYLVRKIEKCSRKHDCFFKCKRKICKYQEQIEALKKEFHENNVQF